MSSVLNVNFGRELLPQGVTIPYTGKQKLCIYLGVDQGIQLGLLAKQYVPGQCGDRYECVLDWDRIS